MKRERTTLIFSLLLLGLLVLGGCGSGDGAPGSLPTGGTTGGGVTTGGAAGGGVTAGTTNGATESTGVDLTRVQSFAYQLQNIDPAALGQSSFGLLVVDFSSDGSDAGRFTPAQVHAMQQGPCGRRAVMAYMSIGEAENYRWYWQKSWDKNGEGVPDAGAPSWLGPSNPQWPGNYKVKYWDPAWQGLIFGSPNSYVDKVIDAGFDGVYLDVIDAYQYWGPGGESGLNRSTAEQEMVDFVEAIARYARVSRGQSHFVVIPQNGSGLASHADYVQAVSGIGAEDTWTDGDNPQPAGDTSTVLGNLDRFEAAGKLVLTIDYPTRADLVNQFYMRAAARGYIPYVSDRGLDRLTINPGHEPSCP